MPAQARAARLTGGRFVGVPSKRTSGDSLVEVRHVRKVFQPFPPLMRLLLRSSLHSPVVALDDVSFEVGPGRICAIVGPNGAGKSTLFRVLTGLITPDSGSASICGLDVTHQAHEVRRLVGFHPGDDRTLFGRNTCRENLVFHGQLQGIPKKALRRRVDEMLELVGLGQARNRAAHALSSGMRARLQLARAMLHRPMVLILDEPTGSLDPVAAYHFMEVITRSVVEEGIAAIISSHRLEEIEALHDYVLLLHEGRIVYRGDLDSLRRIWEQPRIEIEFDTTEESAQASDSLAALNGVQVLDVDATRVVLSSVLPVGAIFALANGQLDGVRSIAKTRMPLIELLQLVLVDQTGGRENG